MKTVTGYEPRFDYDVRRGQVGEAYVGTLLEAIASGSIEVKTDYGSNQTGNLYVEFEQQGQGERWRPSGLATTEAQFWAFAFKDGAVFVETGKLKEVCAQYYREGRIGNRPRTPESNGTRGVLLPVTALATSLENYGRL